ncbi:O-acyltransferase [Dokdonia pacifica]|uniref:D-alanyl-lipoteichoic acid acyltransferase DltB, MBOAT superfamily n=1 Tax=Dokdonia pacifica TaxID=1627892 RepID=A0A238YLW4_9FLAO|nr:MBOAT family O-acyltransferase [Dokdonia pacifica]GGG11356.1 O-acyltransferase [Dokdonia pacifica]SNR72107.1 D-alanyl-lipoteichoic acid acyltransferase DltB, MBOAT superfamily [Dokdonia pacifica]
MLFNSVDFALFLPIVFLLYWGVTHKSIKLQNIFIVVASYLFYGWWDWHFLFLIVTSTLVDFFVGIGLKKYHSVKSRKALLVLSIITNVGILVFFKYYNFFVESFVNAFSLFGKDISASTLNLILPVGISFYTFQTLSYSIDVYKRNIEPTTNFFAFTAFVCFFPQLVAGPIERAKHLLPQFQKKRHFNYNDGVDGLKQILWGLFKKMVIADNCGRYVDILFSNSSDYSSSSLVLGVLFFSFQIYADFSGYSDIAIGVAKLFGFKLKQNFATPYFSKSIIEFWQRWHISLSTWFRDYVYIPLGGSKVGTSRFICNILLVFIISGFWHGASWTFIFWGFFHAILYLITYYIMRKRKDLAKAKVYGFKYVIQVLITFSVVSFAWIFFRAESLDNAFVYIGNLFSVSLFSIPNFTDIRSLSVLLFFISVLLIVEWRGREEPYAIKLLFYNRIKMIRWSFYALLLFFIGMYANTDEVPFIYFQF